MYRDDPDASLRLLARIAQLAPGRLSELAHRIAAEVAVDLARGDEGRRSGTKQLATMPVERGGDLDLDHSLPAIAEARAAGRPVDIDELKARNWIKRDHALTLLIDHSGSMDGDRLVTASLAAAVLAIRSPDDYSVIAFAGEVIVVKAQREPRPLAEVVNDILALRGYGTTDVALGLYAGLEQLARSASSQRIGIAMTDGVSTSGGDPFALAGRFGQLHVVCPADAPEAADRLARRGGGECARVTRPTEVGRVLAGLMR